MSTLTPAFGYAQALPHTTALELYGYGGQIREWAAANGFLLLGVFTDSHIDRAPRFVELIRTLKRLEVKPSNLIIPHTQALGTGGAEVEKLVLVRRYDLHILIADDGRQPL